MKQLIISLVFSLVLGASLKAEIISADLHEATWQAQEQSLLQCQITQDIPQYGTIVISQHAGGAPMVQLQVGMGPERELPALLRAHSPAWQQHHYAHEQFKITLKAAKNVVKLDSKNSMWFINQLLIGNEPSFVMPNWLANQGQITIRSRAVNFKQVYQQYLQCLQKLLPYGFETIQTTSLYFDENSDELYTDDYQKLSKVIKYLEADDDISMIIIKGYSDNLGEPRDSYLLSINRTRAVENYLIKNNMSAEKIDATAYGERYPVASNETAQGRAKNRRVTITLQR